MKQQDTPVMGPLEPPHPENPLKGLAMDKIRGVVDKISRSYRTDIWRVRMETLSFPRRLAVRFIRVFLVSLRGFQSYHCALRASALTFYTVLSIVPVAAMAFGIAGGFGFEQRLEKELMENLPGQEAVVIQVIEFARTLLNSTEGGLIAGVGVAVLFWVVIKVMGNIESSLNAIWEVGKGRSIGRKVGDYLGMMILSPVLVIVSGSATVFIKTQVILMTREVWILGAFSPMIFLALKLLPYILAWVLFSMVYLVMPNTRVRISSAVIAGVIAGTLYQLVQWGYINFQVGVARNNAIYGSFAALPLFLIWLQTSWLIVLFGAVISAAWQRLDELAIDPACRRVSVFLNRSIYLRIVHWLVRRFCDAEPPATSGEIAAALGIPIAMVRELTAQLSEVGILSIVSSVARRKGQSVPDAGDEVAFQPGRDVALLTVKAVVEAMEHRGCDTLAMASTPALAELTEILKEMERSTETSAAKRLLRDIDG
ncbi:YhjD/YihY/BrkB family envelope integrity protein [Desulfococcus sp.]|uniref:YhjD/YihY/BrkB family envelope integrity protein n=1 Tax=Desulfococcus sp. TaxID=2025834 RepID=UPI0035935EC9